MKLMRHLERPSHRREDKIKTCLKVVEWGNGWINVCEDRYERRVVVDTMIFGLHENWEMFD